MRAFFLTLFLTPFLISPAIAGHIPPGFDAQKWNSFVQKVVAFGESTLIEPYTFRHLSRLQPQDKTKPHQADYIRTTGVVDSQDNYIPFSVSAVSENWAVNAEGNWVIDQWLWDVNLDGGLETVQHFMLVETPSGTVLDVQNLSAGQPSSAEELARWSDKFAEWLRTTPFFKK